MPICRKFSPNGFFLKGKGFRGGNVSAGVSEPPPAPEAPTPTATSSSEIVVTFGAPGGGISRHLLTSTTPNFETATDLGEQISPYTHQPLSSDTLYYYWLQDTNAAGTSDPSEVASATTFI